MIKVLVKIGWLKLRLLWADYTIWRLERDLMRLGELAYRGGDARAYLEYQRVLKEIKSRPHRGDGGSSPS